jgi:hypothetical protein
MEEKPHNHSLQEVKLTAALYASRKGVLEHVRATGRLPEVIQTGGFDIGMRLLIRNRGTDITLSEDEQLVFEAILRERRLPGGGVILVPRQED